MRLGLMAYATDTGLGIQTRALYKHLQPAKTMLVDLNAYNHMPVHDDWYTYALRTQGFPTNEQIDSFLQDLDVVFVCETPLNYYLFERANQLGIRTVLQYNYEFLDYMNQAQPRPRPTVLAAPTMWHTEDVRRVTSLPVVDLPVPVGSDLPQRHVIQARSFFHVGGRPAIHDRNGTLDYIQAVRVAQHQMPDASFTLYCQSPTPEIIRAIQGTSIKVVGHLDSPADMYRDNDVLVLPRRYGGLCLPAQEAVGCGIPVLMPDVAPNNQWIPLGWMIPVVPQTMIFTTRCPIEVHQVNVMALAERMVAMYRDDELAQTMHQQAKSLAQTMSWDALLARYEQVLKEAI